MTIVETSVFKRRVDSILSAEEYRLLQFALFQNPSLGKVLKGGSGIRKLRWAIPGKGKSSGIRLIYYHANEQGEILMLFLFAKNEQDELSDEQLKQLTRIVQEEYP